MWSRLDRIVSQPERGAATISADGESIVYASVPATRARCLSGTASSTPSARPARASCASACWTAQSNPSPITFTDYVQVQAGAGNSIRVSPLSNDVDPTLGSLAAHRRAPRPARDASSTAARTTNTTRLADRILSSTTRRSSIEAGMEPGRCLPVRHRVELGNTGRGLIVVKVVRESVPDYPVVADTVLTAETREDFPRASTCSPTRPRGPAATWRPLGGAVGGAARRRRRRRRPARPAPRDDARDPVRGDGRGVGGRGHHLRLPSRPGDDDLALALKSGASPRR